MGRKKSKKKGFTLVELLATIAILGVLSVIAITAVNRYVRSAHDEHNEQSRKSVTMAAELYLQANRQLFPKQIGDETIIPISKLRDNNYLKEDVKNDEGESCMEKSFVRVYKLGKDDYSYTTYLYCGDDIVPDKIIPESPSVVNFEFHGVTKDNQFDTSAVKNADFTFTIYGGQTKNSKEIYSYQYAIMVNTGSGVREVYNSGSIKGNKQKSIDIKSKKLSSYVDIAGNSKVYVEVTVFNTEGGRLDYTSESVGGEGTGTFQDQTKPTCEYIAGQAADDNDWVNKTNLATQMASRRITVDCKDNENGSGCKRQKFSQTWPYNAMSPSGKVNYNFGARWSLVIISDNAKAVNETDCYARVNVDLQAPTITLTVYKAKADGSRGAKVLDSFTVQDNQTKAVKDMPTGTIPVDAYSDLVNTWMNDDKYPNGVIIDAEVTDNLYLYNYKWEVNEKDNSTTLSDESAEQDNGVEASGILTSTVYDDVKDRATLELAEKGLQSAKIEGLRLYREGKRTAMFTMCDKAGNCTTVVMKANIDRTHPECSNKIEYSVAKNRGNQTKFGDPTTGLLSAAGWLGLKDGKKVSTNQEYEKARVTQVCTDPRPNDNADRERSDCPDDMESYVYGEEIQTDTAGALGNGKGGKIHDIAGNYSDCKADQTVQIDYTLPTCTTNLSFGTGTGGSDDCTGNFTSTSNDLRKTPLNTNYGWIGLANGGAGPAREKAKVSQVCKDEGSSIVNSDCNTSKSKYCIYDKEMEVTNAGARGVGKGGYVYDFADNESEECPADQTVKIDYTIPECGIDQDYATGSGASSYPKTIPTSDTSGSTLLQNQWLSLEGGTGGTYGTNKEMTRVYQTCSDPEGNEESSVISDCDPKSISSHVYDYEIVTETAGAEGDGVGGNVYDKAGNKSATCPANKHVWTDYNKPTCNMFSNYLSGGKSFINDKIVDKVEDETYDAEWTTSSIRVSRTCEEKDGKVTSRSGCDDASLEDLYFDYTGANNTHFNTSKAGPTGDNKDVYVVDNAGNKKLCSPKTVKIDRKSPTCSVYSVYASNTSNTYSGGWTNQSIKVYRKCSDKDSSLRDGSLCDTTSAADLSHTYEGTQDENYNTSNAGADGESTTKIIVSDNLGHTAECENKTVKIDRLAPTCSVTATYTSDGTEYTGDWTTSSVTVSRSCSDGWGTLNIEGSGCDTASKAPQSKAYYPTDDVVSSTNATASDVDDPVYVNDVAGNQTLCDGKTVNVDRKAPTGTCEVTGWYNKNSDQKFAITHSITGNAGKDGDPTITYSTNGGTSYGTSTTMTLTCSSSGEKTAKMKLTDTLGNERVVDCTGSITVPGCCDEGYVSYGAWSTCTKPCVFDDDEEPGTQSRTITSNLNGSSCGTGVQECGNTPCCTPTTIKYKQTTVCTEECGGGRYIRAAYTTYYSDYAKAHRCRDYNDENGDECHTESCCATTKKKYGKCSCKRGTRKVRDVSTIDGSSCSPVYYEDCSDECFDEDEFCAMGDNSSEDAKLFGSSRNFSAGNSVTTATDTSDFPAGWCHADGRTCAPDRGYMRICYTDLCGPYKNWKAQDINVDITGKKYPGCFVRYWCSCTNKNF